MTYSKADLVLFGDFNFPGINWSEVTATANTTQAKDFIDVCLNYNLTQLVTQPTRVTCDSSNILDLILTTHPDSLSSIHYLQEISDHKVIHVDFSFCPTANPSQKKTITLYDKGNYDAINNELCTFLPTYEVNFHHRSVQENWLTFKQKLTELIHMFIPKTTIRVNSQKPWFNKTLHHLDNKKKRLFRNAKLKGGAQNWEKYYAAEKAYLTGIRSAKFAFFNNNLPNMLANNPHKF